MSKCTSGRNRELSNFGECFSLARTGDNYYEKRNECIEDMEKEGYEYIGGTTRNVFLMPYGDCVVKMGKRGAGDIFNKREVERSQKEGFQDAVVLVDEYDTEYKWITMPTVEDRPNRKTPWDDVKEVKDKLGEGGWVCQDIDRSNIGYIDEKPVAFDYAEGCKRIENTNSLGL